MTTIEDDETTQDDCLCDPAYGVCPEGVICETREREAIVRRSIQRID